MSEVVLSGELVARRSPDEWARLVRRDLGQAVAGVIAAGRHLEEAKWEVVQFTDWERWCRDSVGISRQTAFRLMTIAGHAVLSNVAHVQHLTAEGGCVLPSSWSTLYELSRLDPHLLEAAITDGRVRPDLTRKDAKALVAEYTTTSGEPDPAIVVLSDSFDDDQPDEFAAIVIDPPWRYGNTSTRGAAEDHYPTMSQADLIQLDLPTADDAHLYLWVTNAFIGDGLELLETWGFRYKTMLTWCKPQIGMGNYFRNTTEHVLFGTRGRLPTLTNTTPTHFVADRKRHSAKPEVFYDIVEHNSPGPRLEMFARRRRLGWHVWGHEA